MTAAVTVRERPILFSSEMVKAILGGRKSQTRRVVSDGSYRGNVKPSLCDLSRAWVDPGPSPAGNPGPYLKAPVVSPEAGGIIERIYPPYFAGDHLWLRESLYQHDDNGWRYAADHSAIELDEDDPRVSAMVSWAYHKATERCPSIHMPRWASRIALEITDVRVERLQAITSADARAEGCEPSERASETDAYHNLWDSLNARRGYGWDVNPWVWAITFARVTP